MLTRLNACLNRIIKLRQEGASLAEVQLITTDVLQPLLRALAADGSNYVSDIVVKRKSETSAVFMPSLMGMPDSDVDSHVPYNKLDKDEYKKQADAAFKEFLLNCASGDYLEGLEYAAEANHSQLVMYARDCMHNAIQHNSRRVIDFLGRQFDAKMIYSSEYQKAVVENDLPKFKSLLTDNVRIEPALGGPLCDAISLGHADIVNYINSINMPSADGKYLFDVPSALQRSLQLNKTNLVQYYLEGFFRAKKFDFFERKDLLSFCTEKLMIVTCLNAFTTSLIIPNDYKLNLTIQFLEKILCLDFDGQKDWRTAYKNAINVLTASEPGRKSLKELISKLTTPKNEAYSNDQKIFFKKLNMPELNLNQYLDERLRLILLRRAIVNCNVALFENCVSQDATLLEKEITGKNLAEIAFAAKFQHALIYFARFKPDLLKKIVVTDQMRKDIESKKLLSMAGIENAWPALHKLFSVSLITDASRKTFINHTTWGDVYESVAISLNSLRSATVALQQTADVEEKKQIQAFQKQIVNDFISDDWNAKQRYSQACYKLVNEVIPQLLSEAQQLSDPDFVFKCIQYLVSQNKFAAALKVIEDCSAEEYVGRRDGIVLAQYAFCRMALIAQDKFHVATSTVLKRPLNEESSIEILQSCMAGLLANSTSVFAMPMNELELMKSYLQKSKLHLSETILSQRENWALLSEIGTQCVLMLDVLKRLFTNPTPNQVTHKDRIFYIGLELQWLQIFEHIITTLTKLRKDSVLFSQYKNLFQERMKELATQSELLQKEIRSGRYKPDTTPHAQTAGEIELGKAEDAKKKQIEARAKDAAKAREDMKNKISAELKIKRKAANIAKADVEREAAVAAKAKKQEEKFEKLAAKAKADEQRARDEKEVRTRMETEELAKLEAQKAKAEEEAKLAIEKAKAEAVAKFEADKNKVEVKTAQTTGNSASSAQYTPTLFVQTTAVPTTAEQQVEALLRKQNIRLCVGLSSYFLSLNDEEVAVRWEDKIAELSDPAFGLNDLQKLHDSALECCREEKNIILSSIVGFFEKKLYLEKEIMVLNLESIKIINVLASGLPIKIKDDFFTPTDALRMVDNEIQNMKQDLIFACATIANLHEASVLLEGIGLEEAAIAEKSKDIITKKPSI